jgi:hypothetical protein
MIRPPSKALPIGSGCLTKNKMGLKAHQYKLFFIPNQALHLSGSE